MCVGGVCVYVLVDQFCPKLYKSMDYNPPGSSVHGISPGKNSGVVAIPFPRDLPDPGIKPGSPALQADSLPSKPSGKPQELKGYNQLFLNACLC